MRNRLVIWLLLALPVLVFLLVAGLRGEVPAFRDASHYYYPLYKWVASEWSQGRVPLWNPYENLGTPVVGDATSGVFYPGMLLFHLPLAYPAKYVGFLASHLLAAGLFAYVFARGLRASRGGAALAAASYMLSGNVLFQYCNAVYLISAAWLPAALLAAYWMVQRRQLRWAVALGAVLALMTLGGDPQTAYHAGLAATLLAALDWWRHRADSDGAPSAGGMLRYRSALLAAAAVTGALLAAIQILPARAWAAESQRAQFDQPRSLYEIPAYLAATQGDDETPGATAAARALAIRRGLVGTPAAGEHDRHIYYFSVAPWRLAEWIWPQVFGEMFPRHRRWSFLLPAAGRIWTPSLYAGFFPLLLGLAALRFRVRGTGLLRCWLSWLLVGSLLAGFGWYGIGWWIHQALHPWRPPFTELGAPTGGLYWALVVLLPGYAYFRFPAKWLVVTTLALSVLAGWTWTHLGSSIRHRRRLAVAAFTWSAVSLLLAAASYPLWLGLVEPVAERAPADEYFGPFDAAGAYRNLLAALLHTSLVAATAGGLLSLRRGSPARREYALVGLTLLELSWAHAGLVPGVEASLFEQPPAGQVALERLEAERGTSPLNEAGSRPSPPPRVYRSSNAGWPGPVDWKQQAAPDRVAAIARWRYHSLHPRFHLQPDQPLALLGSTSTLQSAGWQTLMRWARFHGPRRADGIRNPHPQVLRLLGATAVLTKDSTITDVVEAPREPLPAATELIHVGSVEGNGVEDNPHGTGPGERAWLVYDWQSQASGGGSDRARLRSEYSSWIRQIYFPQGRPADLTRYAVLTATSSGTPPPPPESPPTRDPPAHSVELVDHEPSRNRWRVQTDAPAMLIVNALSTSGWHVWVRQSNVADQALGAWEERPLVTANGLMRAVYLTAGNYQVEFRYAPRTLVIGGIVSGISWAILLIAAIALLLTSWRRARKVRSRL